MDWRVEGLKLNYMIQLNEKYVTRVSYLHVSQARKENIHMIEEKTFQGAWTVDGLFFSDYSCVL